MTREEWFQRNGFTSEKYDLSRPIHVVLAERSRRRSETDAETWKRWRAGHYDVSVDPATGKTTTGEQYVRVHDHDKGWMWRPAIPKFGPG